MIKVIVPVSGGKDSQACLKLALANYEKSEVIGLFCDTQFEHPITYKHVDDISDKYGIHIYKISAGSVEMQIRKHKIFPSGTARFCTDELKIGPSKRFYQDFAKGNGPFEVWLGMRAKESKERAKRYAGKVGDDVYPPHEVLSKFPKGLADAGVMFRLPILEWTEKNVFDYLAGEENPLYAKGFSRVGCFPCLAAGDAHKERAFSFDATGRKHFKLVRSLEPITNCSIFTSKRGQLRNDSGQTDFFEGCSICAI